ncbi:MAG: hypothetical protein FWG79_00600, partial [Bacteroidales bacterium]|nr:hypothetical protein [Bacteroidales bacterium]
VSGATSYNWTIPGSMTHDGSDGTTINITDAGTTTGSLAISVTASNSCGTSSPSTANITIGTTPNTPGTITFSPTSVCMGAAFTASISAVSGATSYNWTTPSNMTATASNSTSLSVTNAGTTTGNFEVSVTATGSCGTSSPSMANITVHAAFAAGTIASTGQALCAGSTAFTQIGSTTAASGGAPNIEYQWLRGATVLANSNSATFTPTAATGAGTYTRQARNTGAGACQTAWVTSSGSWVVSFRNAFAAGTIASTGQTLISGQAFTTIGSTTAASGGAPNIEYRWLRGATALGSSNNATYTPTAAGTYTRQARNTGAGACQTAWETSSGSWVVVVIPACSGTPGNLANCTGANNVAAPGTVSWGGVNNINTNARTISGNGITQQWSGVVTTTNCNKATYTSDNTVTDCRRPTNGFNGHYFNFCFVIRHAATLCPSPWRVPTCQDFVNLDVALGGNGNNRNTTVNGHTITTQVAWYIGTTGDGDAAQNNVGSTWGGTRFTANTSDLTIAHSDYWSSSENSATNAFYLTLLESYIYPRDNTTKSFGFALRCVR